LDDDDDTVIDSDTLRILINVAAGIKIGGTDSVTRPPLLTTQPENPSTPQCLIAGIDSLDLGLYVNWGKDWDKLFTKLDTLKELAGNNDYKEPVLIELPNLEPILVHASGKPPMYRFYLQSSDYHLWIGKSQTPQNNTPNVYLSLNSEPIWRDGLAAVIQRLRDTFTALGATIDQIQPSRVDLCCDFDVPEGFDLHELLEQTVCNSGIRNIRIGDNGLETYYVGSDGSALQMRLYNKSKEILVHPDRSFFRELWKVQSSTVWRAEFEMRRPFLQEHVIDTLDDFLASRKTIWRYLTSDWVTIRQGEDSNKSRREFSPFWQAVQNVADHFDGTQPLQRREKGQSVPQQSWYLTRIRGYVETLAALWSYTDSVQTLRTILKRLSDDWAGTAFTDRVTVKAIEKGWPVPQQQEDSHAQQNA